LPTIKKETAMHHEYIQDTSTGCRQGIISHNGKAQPTHQVTTRNYQLTRNAKGRAVCQRLSGNGFSKTQVVIKSGLLFSSKNIKNSNLKKKREKGCWRRNSPDSRRWRQKDHKCQKIK
jgi:hypothetical protein